VAHSPVSPAPPIRPGPSAPSASVRCEILPVTCIDGHIVTLRRGSATDSSAPGWCYELPPGQHPTQTVVNALSRELDGIFDPATSIVHSTSWRYEAEHLVLSYLTVLQPARPLTTAPLGFLLQPVQTESDRASRTGDPRAIAVIDVLTHGLRHLAMLRISDPEVAENLSGCWHELLASWRPLPAGLLELYAPGHPAPVNRPATSALPR
jgi:hypothetical protein